MKVVAYSIQAFEKEFLIKANQKKHDITLISNRLTDETVGFAAGKDAVIVFATDDVSKNIVEKLAAFGVKFITTRSASTEHIDKQAAGAFGIKVANVPPIDESASLTTETLQDTAAKTINNLDMWQQQKCVGNACACAKNCRAIPDNILNKE
ncbi:lactate dehydrogenase [Mucilaginibacter calamicampi]|uniref:Lactate dehydrogenase n=1 Tax=Mucilaginibacter calamicampi TaxID=1302352 RepID=A0ABW2YXJ3_9SPHI